MNEQTPFEPLSRREREILALLCEKLTDREIAKQLFLALPTVKWYNRQIFSKLGVENRREACKYLKSLGLLAQNGAAESAPTKHNLPSQLTPFVGRSRELAEIEDRLAHPHTRLLTILAPGGMGKTRLALEAAERSLSRYADGVFFAPLAALTSTDHVVPGLAEALGLQFTPDGRTQTQQLTDFLRRKHMLLVIDNFEHLLDAAPLITDLLTTAPKVTALVTSRERLNLNGEIVYTLVGLDYPETDADDPLLYGAAELLIECALRANARFVIEDAATIGRLCRRVQGMPLAIELAAAWSGALSVDEIDNEIARSADFLHTTMVDVPERLRSVRAVFEAAWARLDEDTRQVFRRMSVFRGGCTREAAHAVTGASIRTLAALVDKALLWRDPQSGRYDIHELLRQYAEAELECAGETDATKQAHQEYYADLSATWGAALSSGKQLEAFATLDTELENIRQALARASRRGIASEIDPFTHLTWYYDRRSLWGELFKVFELAAEQLGPDDSVTLAKLLIGQTVYYMRFTMIQELFDTAKRSVDMLRRLEERGPLPLALLRYAIAGLRSGRSDFVDVLREALQIAREIGDSTVAAAIVVNLGIWESDNNNKIAAKVHFDEAIRLHTQSGNYAGLCHPLITSGLIAFEAGELDDAERSFTRCLIIAQSINFPWQADNAKYGLCQTALERRDIDKAFLLANEVLEYRRSTGRPDHQIFDAVIILCQIAMMKDRSEEARQQLRVSISLYNKRIEADSFTAWLIVAGAYLVRVGDFVRATIMLRRANDDDAREPTFTRLYKEIFHDLSNQCREALSPEEFEAAWERGQTMTNEEAIALVAEALR